MDLIRSYVINCRWKMLHHTWAISAVRTCRFRFSSRVCYQIGKKTNKLFSVSQNLFNLMVSPSVYASWVQQMNTTARKINFIILINVFELIEKRNILLSIFCLLDFRLTNTWFTVMSAGFLYRFPSRKVCQIFSNKRISIGNACYSNLFD